MTTNFNIQPESKTSFKASAGLQAGYKKLGDDQILVFGPRAEVGFERNGWHGKAGLGIGTALATDLEVGKEFKFNKTLGLDLTANASNTCSVAFGDNKITHGYGTPEGVKEYSKKWNSNITEAGARAMMNITPNEKVKIGVGVSGQYVRNNAPDFYSEFTYEGKTYSNESLLHREGFKVSPELALDWQAGKNISIGANANLRGGNATVRYIF